MYVSDRCLLVKSYDTGVLSTRQHNTSTNNVHSTTCLCVVILGSLYMCCYDYVVVLYCYDIVVLCVPLGFVWCCRVDVFE